MRAAIVGTGNIAYHYARILHKSGFEVTEVIGRNLKSANNIIHHLPNTKATDDLSKINIDLDLYVIAVVDQAISKVADQLPKTIKGIVIHTSGATPLEILNEFEKFGVVYPVQSLSKLIPTDYKSLPIGIEGNDDKTFASLITIFSKCSSRVFPLITPQRMALHVAGVFANNFSNVMFRISNEILQSQNLDFDLLKPLIAATAEKAVRQNPADVQTGPAIRKDFTTIEKHLEFLKKSPKLKDIYQKLSDYILNN